MWRRVFWFVPASISVRSNRDTANECNPSLIVPRHDDELRVDRLMWDHAVVARDIQSVAELLRPG